MSYRDLGRDGPALGREVRAPGYGEHDLGLARVQGHAVLFKIDAYDLDLNGHSPDPADPAVTCRVMTLMLADEY